MHMNSHQASHIILFLSSNNRRIFSRNTKLYQCVPRHANGPRGSCPGSFHFRAIPVHAHRCAAQPSIKNYSYNCRLRQQLEATSSETTLRSSGTQASTSLFPSDVIKIECVSSVEGSLNEPFNFVLCI